MKSSLALSVSAAVLILIGVPRTAAAQGTVQTARYVPDVVAQFSALTERADAMGFELVLTHLAAYEPAIRGQSSAQHDRVADQFRTTKR